MKYLYFFILLFYTMAIYPCDKKVITVAWEIYPPFEIGDANSNHAPNGLSIDLFLAAAKKIGCLKNINFVNYPWTRDLNELKKGKVDVMFNALRTEERKQYAFYKKYFIKSRNAIFIKESDYEKLSKMSFKELIQINNFMIGYTNGYDYGDLLGKIQSEFPKKFEMSNNNEFTIIKTSHNRISAFLGDVVSSQQFIKELKEKSKIAKNVAFKALPIELSSKISYTYMIYSKKGLTEQLVDKFDNAFTELYNEGTTEKIFSK